MYILCFWITTDRACIIAFTYYAQLKSKTTDDMEFPVLEYDREINEIRFKPFQETYRKITMCLTLGLLFPNPANDRVRITCIVVLMVAFQPLCASIILDMYKCWLDKDVFNIIRHSTIVGPFLGAFFKMFLMYYKRVQAKQIIDEMNHDYSTYNSVPLEHKQIAWRSIQNSIFCVEKIWSYMVTCCIMGFPAIGAILTLFSYLTQSEPKKYMVHDLNRPFRLPEERFESPFFECAFVYMTLAAVTCLFNYLSYDGFFGLACYHATLKMELFCKKLEDAFECGDSPDLYMRLVEVIEDQKRMFEFVRKIQDTFNIWLGTIYLSTIIEIGSLLFHISAGYGFDFRYTLFCFTAVVHIFLPCTYASKLKNMSMETSTLMYCSGWELVREPRIRRVMPFLLARAQLPNRITAFYMLEFDMELFVALMRTSYSVFTLLRS